MENIKFKRTVYSLTEFLEVDVAEWGNRLKAHHIDCMKEEASPSQRKAWFDCFNILRKEILLLHLSNDSLNNIFILFEYELPRERGRRPDVLILSGNNLIVLEFKGFVNENIAHIDQLKHYVRDLGNYHERSHSKNIIPILVLAMGKGILHISNDIQVVSGDLIHKALARFLNEPFDGILEWYESDYAPLPSLIESAQILFQEQQLPQIKKALSAGIPETLNELAKIAQLSQNSHSHHLALITGVPGAGKTLVGLQFVLETYKQRVKQKAVFLSGNGPLVDVLQYSLKTRSFVQSVHGFLKQYAHSSQLPSEDVLIYDEAQRAWDSERVTNSHREGGNSEPVDFIRIGNRLSHCLIIGLIGEGQEIYLGEESGMQLWSEAVNLSDIKWIIHCPKKLKNIFLNSQVEVVEEFDLTVSLRTHLAVTLQNWVENLLENRIKDSNRIYNMLYEENYPIYITRDLSVAKSYLQEKYEGEINKTYGIIASSKNRVLPENGIPNDFNSTKSFTVSQYYVDSTHPAFCKNLNHVVTEFGCQGLELDMPLLAWDGDWIYNNGWKDMTPNKKARDSYRLRKNSYRVLLTRGRDGIVIFVPRVSILDSTYQVLIDAGCKTL
jgi:hypothetical protein